MDTDEVRQAICKLLSEANVVPPEEYRVTLIRFHSRELAQRFHDLVQQLPVGG